LNSDLLKEIEGQDYPSITKNIEEFLKNQVESTKADGLILGLSGGVDSSVIAVLCSRVLKDKTLALIMPDSEISPKIETENALNLVHKLGIDYKLIDINLIINSYSKYLEPNDFAKGNLRARVRANILYYYANSKNYLVLGSGDKSEWLIGYFTKFGDGASDLMPIISLYKTQVKKIAEYIGVPQEIISMKSSPNLWKDHFAEKEIGVNYEDTDSILYCLFDKKLTIQETINKSEITKQTVEKIFQLYKNSEHKRNEAERL